MSNSDNGSGVNPFFVSELKELLTKHNIHLIGTVRAVNITEDYDLSTIVLEAKETLDCPGGIVDRTGPFLVSSIEKKFVPPEYIQGRSIQISPDYQGYDCPVTGKWIEGRAAHRENLKRTGCRLSEKGEKQEYIKSLQDADQRVSRDIESILHEIAPTI